jgi:large subunit ribosomal protein L18
MDRLKDKRRRRLRRKLHIRKRVSGTSEKPRMSIFKSNRHLYVQVIDDSEGTTLAAASNMEKDLRDIKMNAKDAGRLGQVIGQRLKEKKIKQVVFDRNGFAYHGVVKAVADGAREAGIQF